MKRITLKKRSSLLQRWRFSCKFRSRWIDWFLLFLFQNFGSSVNPGFVHPPGANPMTSASTYITGADIVEIVDTKT
jgi:hypothetical protein